MEIVIVIVLDLIIHMLLLHVKAMTAPGRWDRLCRKCTHEEQGLHGRVVLQSYIANKVTKQPLRAQQQPKHLLEEITESSVSRSTQCLTQNIA